jgi:HK97 family phage major capsid protein
MVFPADLEHMHSVYALYDTAGRFADGTYAKSAGHLPHHVVDENGTPGPHHPDAVRAALDALPSLPVTDEQRAAAAAHLEAHMKAPAASEVHVAPPGDTGATNGSGTNTKVTIVPTSSSGRDDEDQEHDRAETTEGAPDQEINNPISRADTWTAEDLHVEADTYARAVAEVSGGALAAYDEAYRAFTLDWEASQRKFDPDHDGDDDSTPETDTDHDYFPADGSVKLSAEGRGGDAPGDGSKPYGNVHYADPGYQKDGKKRYPVDTKDHASAAWGYINQGDNAGKYSSGDLAKVKAAIKAACKKFGIAISEDSDGDGTKSTSSSGRQPAATDQQSRDEHADAGSEGTGPPEQERADAAPLTHPATDDDTSSSRSTPMDGPMKVAERTARVTAIQERLTAIHALHPDGDMPAELDAEWKSLDEERGRHAAAIKDASDRAAMIAAFTSARNDPAVAAVATETAPNPGFGESAGNSDDAESGRSKFSGAPNFIPSTDRAALYDVEAVKASCRSYQDVPRAFRDRAMKILEVDGRGFPNVRYSPTGEPHITRSLTMEDAQTRVATLLDTVDDEHGSLARRVMVTGNPTYERAFGKALTQLSIVGLDDVESRALALGVDGQGGYAVPFQLDPTVILTSNGAINPIRQLARVETITGKEWDGVTSAGVTVTRASEGAEVGTGDAAFIQPTVRTSRVQGFVPFSVELDVSWGALRSQMTALLMDAKDIEEATSFLTGSGTAPQPVGLIQGISQQTVAVGTASTVFTAGTATLAVGDLYALENAMPARFRQQSAYLASRTTYNRFRQLFQALASAAFDSWVRPSAGQPATFNGYPAFEASPMVGTISSGSQVLVQGDYRQFLIVDRVGMGIELVPHLFGGTNRYPTGQRGILAIWFNSSQVLVPNAFRLLQTT